jgi:hypothetical protein
MQPLALAAKSERAEPTAPAVRMRTGLFVAAAYESALRLVEPFHQGGYVLVAIMPPSCIPEGLTYSSVCNANSWSS